MTRAFHSDRGCEHGGKGPNKRQRTLRVCRTRKQLAYLHRQVVGELSLQEWRARDKINSELGGRVDDVDQPPARISLGRHANGLGHRQVDWELGDAEMVVVSRRVFG